MAMVDRTDAEVRRIIRNFMSGDGDEWDWDDFIALKISDPYLEAIRKIAEHLPMRYPPKVPGHYCDGEGRDRLKVIANDLLS